eukprot:6208654-Pleurochrysis_carterae.AAC.5
MDYCWMAMRQTCVLRSPVQHRAAFVGTEQLKRNCPVLLQCCPRLSSLAQRAALVNPIKYILNYSITIEEYNCTEQPLQGHARSEAVARPTQLNHARLSWRALQF